METHYNKTQKELFMKKIIVMVCVFSGLLIATSWAETLILKGGKTIEGRIVDKTDRLVKIQVRGVTLTYDTVDIERIEGGAHSSSINPKAAEASSYPVPPVKKPVVVTTLGETGAIASSPEAAPADELVGMPKRDLILALVEASGARDKLNEVFDQAMAHAQPQEAERLKQIFNIDEMINEIVPVYDKYFTEDELVDLIRFYRTPLGHKLFIVTPSIIEESTKASLTYFQSKIKAMQPQTQTQTQTQPQNPVEVP